MSSFPVSPPSSLSRSDWLPGGWCWHRTDCRSPHRTSSSIAQSLPLSIKPLRLLRRLILAKFPHPCVVRHNFPPPQCGCGHAGTYRRMAPDLRGFGDFSTHLSVHDGQRGESGGWLDPCQECRPRGSDRGNGRCGGSEAGVSIREHRPQNGNINRSIKYGALG